MSRVRWITLCVTLLAGLQLMLLLDALPSPATFDQASSVLKDALTTAPALVLLVLGTLP